MIIYKNIGRDNIRKKRKENLLIYWSREQYFPEKTIDNLKVTDKFHYKRLHQIRSYNCLPEVGLIINKKDYK